MIDDDVRYWCEMAEAIAFRETVAALQEQGDAALAPEWAEIGGGVAFALRGIDHPFFNRSIGLGIPRPATRDGRRRPGCLLPRPRTRLVRRPAGRTDPAARARRMGRGGGIDPEPAVAEAVALPGGRAARAADRVCGSSRSGPIGRTTSRGSWSPRWGSIPSLAPLATATMGRPGWSHYLGFDGDVACRRRRELRDGGRCVAGLRRDAGVASGPRRRSRRCSRGGSPMPGPPAVGSRSPRPARTRRRSRTRATATCCGPGSRSRTSGRTGCVGPPGSRATPPRAVAWTT